MADKVKLSDQEALQQVLCLALVMFSCSPLNMESHSGDRILRIITKLWKGPTPIEAGLSGGKLVAEMLPWLEEIAGIPPEPPAKETLWERLGKDD
jgi:hypothetical protein